MTVIYPFLRIAQEYSKKYKNSLIYNKKCVNIKEGKTDSSDTGEKMDIGKRIYELRSAKLMTQAELAGDQITRNMLCLIEKGAANPSLSTILYIAKKLNVSAGYLLADEQEEPIYKKLGNIENIKKAFEDQNFQICRDLCLECITGGAEDDEIDLILAECDIMIAKEEIFVGALRSACEYISEALDYADRTAYHTGHIGNIASLYSTYLSGISPTLDIGLEKSDYYLSDDLFYNYIYFYCNFGKLKSRELGVEFAESFYYKHLLATELMKDERFEEAYSQLSEILKADGEIPSPVLYSVFSDLEICCREREDFKGAYEYSSNKIRIFEKMLSGN